MNFKLVIPLFFLVSFYSCSTAKEETQNANISIVEEKDIDLRNALRHKGKTDKHQNRHKRRLSRQAFRKSRIIILTDSSVTK